MSDIKESLRNFSSVYASKGRREFDVGFLIFREDLLDGEKTQIENFWGCTRLADMLPSKYEDNTLQIKEKSTERTALFFCAPSYRPFRCRYFGHSAQLRYSVLPQNSYGHQPSFGLGCR